MTGRKSAPPALALWCLRHLLPSHASEALTGDLVENFRHGKTRAWFWKQVLAAMAAAALAGLRSHWPHICYALAGTWAMSFERSEALRRLPGFLHWTELPWPLSQLAFEMSRSALLALAVLSILAAGLLIEGQFHWTSLIRTAVLNLALITLGHFSGDIFPWIWRPIPGDPNHGKFCLIPPDGWRALLCCAFLLAAWIGCRPSTPLTPEPRQ